MLNQTLVVARKEILDGVRDVRSVISSLLYALMGPLVVGLVSIAVRPETKPSVGGGVLVGMMSVFTLVAAFVGGMNVAMDTVAGERERRSLLPLLLNPVPRLRIVLGKWLAVSVFSTGGLILNLTGFAVVIAMSGMHMKAAWTRFLPSVIIGILPLALLAASTQLLISTVCRAVKEAQTYLSMIVFLPMGIGMFLVFFPAANRVWCDFLPLVGQQRELELLMNGGELHLFQPVVLGCLTLTVAFLVLLVAANRLYRDEIIYGN
jgi:sodium transport system permease protein